MREIKFRGKDLNGVWRHGSLVNNVFFYADTKKGVPYIFDVEDVDYYCLADLEDGEGFYEMRPDTIGQFTGLHDKNGKEIYEGDIIKIVEDDEPFYTEVKFYKGVFGVENWTENTRNRCLTTLNHFMPTIGLYDEEQEYTIEVVGNVYDNKELLDTFKKK